MANAWDHNVHLSLAKVCLVAAQAARYTFFGATGGQSKPRSGHFATRGSRLYSVCPLFEGLKATASARGPWHPN